MINSVLSFTFFILISFPIFAGERVERISEKEMDISRPNTIYMTPGRSTLLDFPCVISHSILGLTDDVKLRIGPDNKRTMTLWLSHEHSQPTNLTVKCDDEIYVFDIYPNRYSHQDYIDIVNSYDKRSHSRRRLIRSSSQKKSASENNQNRILLKSSKSAQKTRQPDSRAVLKRLNSNGRAKKLISKGVVE